MLTSSNIFLVAFLAFLLTQQCTVAIRCLSCNAVIQPRHCSRIESCPEGNACVTESFQNKNGETLFNVGCMSAQRCSLNANRNSSARTLRTDINGTHQRDVCTECCHSDLCNAAGCGMIGYPQQRGPVCLNCPQTRDPADCDVIDVCLRGKVCHVEEIFEFGDVFYKTSCVWNSDYQCSSHPIHNPAEIGRRSTGRDGCFFCCPDDLCNNKCNSTTSHVPSTISSTTPAPTHHSFKGKDFFLMYIKNAFYPYDDIKLQAIVTSQATNANIQVITQYNSTSFPVSGPVKHIDIDANMIMRENGRTGKGVIITSDTPVSVIAFNFYKQVSSAGYLALPVESLGVEYIVGTARPNTVPSYQFGTEFAVGAPYDNTVVNITPSTSGVSVSGQYHRERDTFTVVLDKLDTFYIETNTTTEDLTGTRIESDKPIAVVSGNPCFFGEVNCNHLVEYLPPVSKWGTRFMAPPISGSTKGIIRIISSVNNTKVVVLSGTLNRTYTVSNYVDIDTNQTKSYAISSDHPVLVLQYMYPGNVLPADERKVEITLVPSTNQFSSEPVLVSPPTNYAFNNFIVVTIRESDVSGLQLRAVNGTDLPKVGSLSFPDADGEAFSFITVTCNNNQTCSVQHTDSTVVFSVIVYGYRNDQSYAYPANIML